MKRPAKAHATIPCRSTARASDCLRAPNRWATCTEKPMVMVEHTPQNIHRLEFISPTEAEASAPRWPTIEASIYCIMIVDNWAMIAGTDSLAVSAICCLKDSGSPFCI